MPILRIELMTYNKPLKALSLACLMASGLTLSTAATAHPR